VLKLCEWNTIVFKLDSGYRESQANEFCLAENVEIGQFDYRRDCHFDRNFILRRSLDVRAD
jgi:hypothetical protein